MCPNSHKRNQGQVSFVWMCASNGESLLKNVRKSSFYVEAMGNVFDKMTFS